MSVTHLQQAKLKLTDQLGSAASKSVSSCCIPVRKFARWLLICSIQRADCPLTNRPPSPYERSPHMNVSSLPQQSLVENTRKKSVASNVRIISCCPFLTLPICICILQAWFLVFAICQFFFCTSIINKCSKIRSFCPYSGIGPDHYVCRYLYGRI